jgi:hypothetical protein
MAKRKGLVRIWEAADIVRELEKVARGNEASLPVSELVVMALPLVAAGMRDRELDRLEAMFLLPDTRG